MQEYIFVKTKLFFIKVFALIRMKFSTIENTENMQSKSKMTSIIAIGSIS